MYFLRNVLSVITTIVIFITSVIPQLFNIKGEDIVILYTNDVHCAVSNEESFGYAGVAAYRNETAKSHDNVTLVDCGDHVQGSSIGSLSKGTIIVDIMNKVGYDYAAIGNHEFDYGMPQLSSLISQADYDYLCCDITYSGNGENLLNDVKAYDIVDYGDTQVAYIGVSTPGSVTSSTPKNFQDDDGNFIYTFSSDPSYDVQKRVLEARAKGADYVVVLSHLGNSPEEPYTSFDLAENTVGIDAIFDAHDHNTFNENAKNKNGDNVIIASTGTELKKLGKLEISPEGKLTNTLVSASEYTTKDNDIQKYVDEKNKEFDAILDKKAGTSDYKLTIYDSDGYRMVRNRETTCGDFVADAYRAAADAQIGLVNGGGVRADIKSGDITYRDIFEVNPFGNAVCKVEATGQMIADALEFACKDTKAEYREGDLWVGEFGGFLQVSGLKFTIDTSIPTSVTVDGNNMFTGVSGQRRVKDILVEDNGTWVPLDMNKKYTIGGAAYAILRNGDGQTAFNGCTVISADLSLDVDTLYKYIESNDGKIDSKYAATQGRITII